VAPQLAASRLVPPDVLIDGLVTHAPFHQFKAANNADNLLWRVILAQEPANDGKVALSIVSIAPGSSPPGNGAAISSEPSIALVDTMTSITQQFTGDGAAVSTELPGYLGHIKVLLKQV